MGYRGSIFFPASCGPWNESPGNYETSAANPDFMDSFGISEPLAEARPGSVIIVVPIADFEAVGSLPDCNPRFAFNATSPRRALSCPG